MLNPDRSPGGAPTGLVPISGSDGQPLQTPTGDWYFLDVDAASEAEAKWLAEAGADDRPPPAIKSDADWLADPTGHPADLRRFVTIGPPEWVPFSQCANLTSPCRSFQH